jgi:hypothetical protein
VVVCIYTLVEPNLVAKLMKRQETEVAEGELKDIYDGAIYQLFLPDDTGGLRHWKNISLTAFIDGAPKGKVGSCWPIIYVINELPPKERFDVAALYIQTCSRFKYYNCIFGAITIGKTEPFMAHYLRENVKELKKLYEQGMNVEWTAKEGGRVTRIHPEHSHIKVTLLCICADTKGKTPVMGMFSFNKGEGGCSVCDRPCTWMAHLNKGVYLEKELGNGRPIKANIFDGYEDMKQKAPERINIPSPLLHLEYFDICKQVPLDAMHICWLGVRIGLVF